MFRVSRCLGFTELRISVRSFGDSNLSVTDTRATTDKNDPLLNMVFKHGKWVDKNEGTMQYGFWRFTKNTQKMLSVICLDERHLFEGCMHLMVYQWRPQWIEDVRRLQSQFRSVNV